MPEKLMQHRQESYSPRAAKARENNTLEILRSLSQGRSPYEAPQEGSGVQAETPAIPTELPSGGNQVEKSIDYLLSQPPEQMLQYMQAQAFDEEGNFKMPPTPDYWLNVLERINKTDPTKQGRDWRDDAIDRFKKVKTKLDQIKASMGGQ